MSKPDIKPIAIEQFEDNYEEIDLRLFRLKFISEVGN